MCGGIEGGLSLDGVDLDKETVLQGTVSGPDGSPLGGAYVRLLDRDGEFTAEVPTSATGGFRFFAGPGSWTLRALAPAGSGEVAVAPTGPGVTEVDLRVGV